MAISSSQIPALLLPGVRKIKGDYQDMPQQWSMIYAKGVSHMEAEKTVHVRYLPLPQLKTTGAPTQFDQNAGQRFSYNHIHIAFGLGYSFTREALKDNLYKTSFNAANLGLMRSFRQMKEIVGAATLNTGQTLNPTIGGDNLPLFSTQHPVDGYTVANTPATQVGLNENSLTMANNMIRRFRDNAGLLYGSQGKKLVVPVELRHVAKRLMETQLRPGTTNNDTWSVKENDDLRDGYVVMDFLTSPYAWFVLSDAGGLIYLEREPFETSMQTDFTTDNLMVKAYERFYMGYDDWRCAVGFYPTN
jgi:hypothetical protein